MAPGTSSDRLPQVINCCYSSKDCTEAATPGQRYYPSLAMQFIKMGVKAVVVPGWRVDGAAGLKFAARLYRELLDGMSFGHRRLPPTWARYCHCCAIELSALVAGKEKG